MQRSKRLRMAIRTPLATKLKSDLDRSHQSGRYARMNENLTCNTSLHVPFIQTTGDKNGVFSDGFLTKSPVDACHSGQPGKLTNPKNTMKSQDDPQCKGLPPVPPVPTTSQGFSPRGRFELQIPAPSQCWIVPSELMVDGWSGAATTTG